MLNFINSLACIPALWPSTWLLDTHGLRPGILCAALGTVAAGLLRWLSFLAPTPAGKVGMLGVGSFSAGLFGPFALEASTKAAAHWFSGNGRLTANAVMSIGAPLGVAAGQFLGPLIVNEDPNNIDLFNFVIFAFTVFCFGGAFLVFNNPSHPPSASASQEKVKYGEGWRQIIWNRHFWIAVTVGGTAIATPSTMSTFSSNYLKPYGYSEDLAGNLGMTLFGGGIASAIVLSRVLDYTKAHITVMKVLAFTLLIGVVLFYVACVHLNAVWLLYCGCVVIGMGAIPNLAITLELCVESTFPIAEATSTGILYLFSQIFTVVMIALSNALIDSDGKPWKSLVMLITFNGITCVAAALYNTPNRRIELEKKKVNEL
ncbi:major facilitator superfamily domain-containing protein [Obelidium mucronatum]|nr:major facilitator superfamily domain-containing protein [Obelidium mucronatum]